MGMPRPDYQVRDEGTVVLIWPITDAAAAWMDDNLPTERMRWSGATVVEHHYAGAVLNGMAEDGLVGRQYQPREGS